MFKRKTKSSGSGGGTDPNGDAVTEYRAALEEWERAIDAVATLRQSRGEVQLPMVVVSDDDREIRRVLRREIDARDRVYRAHRRLPSK